MRVTKIILTLKAIVYNNNRIGHEAYINRVIYARCCLSIFKLKFFMMMIIYINEI